MWAEMLLKIAIIIVSVLHQNEGGIRKSILDAREISSRVEGNLEAGGNGFPNPSRLGSPEFWWSTDTMMYLT